MPPTRRSTRPAAQTVPYAKADDHRSGGTSTRGVRSTRNPRALVEPDSDIDEDDEEPQLDDVDEDMDDAEVEVEDDDAPGEEDDLMEDEDAEGEEDDDEDEITRSHPPPPRIQIQKNVKGKPSVVVKPPKEGPLKSVEGREIDEVEDEELSELDSDEGEEDEDDDGQDQSNINAEDDEDLDDEDELGDSDDEGGTPDPSKLTRRQRGQFDDFEGGLMALSNEAQKKKHISAEEHAMRRAEMARRRKNLSEKRNEEEKIDTINKLLKKPAPKRRTRAEMLAAQLAEAGTPGAEGEDEEARPDPLYTRWVSNAAGNRLGVPIEWIEAPLADDLAENKANKKLGRASIQVEEVS